MPPKILIIDDEAPLRLLYRVTLEAEGLTVIEAEDGEAGLQVARRELPDLILCDVMMPGLLGWDVAKRLRANARTRRIPLVFATPLAKYTERLRGYSLGAVDYITLPLNPLALGPHLTDLLEELSARSAAEIRREKVAEIKRLMVSDPDGPAPPLPQPAEVAQKREVSGSRRSAAEVGKAQAGRQRPALRGRSRSHSSHVLERTTRERPPEFQTLAVLLQAGLPFASAHPLARRVENHGRATESVVDELRLAIEGGEDPGEAVERLIGESSAVPCGGSADETVEQAEDAPRRGDSAIGWVRVLAHAYFWVASPIIGTPVGFVFYGPWIGFAVLASWLSVAALIVKTE